MDIKQWIKKEVKSSCITKFIFKSQNIFQIGQGASHFSEPLSLVLDFRNFTALSQLKSYL